MPDQERSHHSPQVATLGLAVACVVALQLFCGGKVVVDGAAASSGNSPAGSGPSSSATAGATTAGGPCAPVGEPCGAGCCFTWACSAGGLCAPPDNGCPNFGARCYTDADCCPLLSCIGGFCNNGSEECIGTGKACTASDQCCALPGTTNGGCIKNSDNFWYCGGGNRSC